MSKKAISRNAPCPCGSGKKYKKCCQEKEKQPSSDHVWRRLLEANSKIADYLIRYSAEYWGEEALYDAWEEFTNFREDEPFDFDSPQMLVFLAWFHFNWRPEDGVNDENTIDYKDINGAEEDSGEDNIAEYPDLEKVDNSALDIHLDDEYFDAYNIPTIAQSYLSQHPHRVSEMERRLMELCSAEEFSYYEILALHPGEGFKLRNLILETEIYVKEYHASEYAEIKSILFAKIVQYDEVALMAGCAPILIPPQYKNQILDLRAKMQSDEKILTNRSLFEWDFDVRELYWNVCDDLHELLDLENSEGDPLCFQQLFFNIIVTPQIAFDKLKSLGPDIPEDELLSFAEYDDAGNLVYVAFPCVKDTASSFTSEYPTMLGEIIIDQNEIIVSTNSENRAAKIREEIENRLSGQVVFNKSEIDELDSAPEGDAADFSEEDLQEGLDHIFDNAVKEIIEKQWMSWIDEKIPALGGKTPREMVKTKEGREKVTSLLDEIEMRVTGFPQEIDQLESIKKVRKKLGLD